MDSVLDNRRCGNRRHVLDAPAPDDVRWVPPEPKQRVLRFMGSCLSLLYPVGLLWSLVDEECLTWQDHISCTFPTPREGESQVFRRV